MENEDTELVQAPPESEKRLSVHFLHWRFKPPKLTKENRRVAFSLVGALTVLYAFLGLLFAGFLVASIEVRQEEWLELPSDFFGPFSKVERPLFDLRDRRLRRTVVEGGPDFSAVTVPRLYNRPDGCVLSEDGTRQDCDRENEEDGRWVIFPWVLENRDRLQSVMTCSSPDQTFASILPNGRVGDGEGNLGDSVCINFVPLDATANLAEL